LRELTIQEQHVATGFAFISVHLIWNLTSWNYGALAWCCWNIFY